MLDDLSYIHQIDKLDTLGIATREPLQLNNSFQIEVNNSLPIDNVICVAMGGSALAADLSKSWPGYRLPFEIVRDYNLPAYVNSKTLCIFSSYSGNTEETLSALKEAEERHAQIVAISSGGLLLQIAQEKHYPYIKLSGGMQPRYAVLENFKAVIEIGNKYNIFVETDLGIIEQAVKLLVKESKQWTAVVPTKDNLAKQIGLDCLGKSVVIYAGNKLAPAAHKWKIDFNENAKQLAWQGTLSEFNHNEFIGWSEQPIAKPFAVIDLRSTYEHPQVQKRFTYSQRLLSGRRPDPIIVQAKGSNLLEQLLYCILLGDFVSLYAAIAAGNNPESLVLIEKLKLMLKDNNA